MKLDTSLCSVRGIKFWLHSLLVAVFCLSLAACGGGSSAGSATYTVSVATGTGGGISPSSATVAEGETTAFTVTPDVGYEIAAVNGCSGSLSGTTYTTGVVTADCTVAASFIRMYTVSATAGTGGGISPSSATVAEGETTAFTVAPDAGYQVAAVSGCSGSLSGATYTTGAITGDCTVTASFSLITYSVTASAGAGGAISPSSATVAMGDTMAFTLTPDAGREIVKVSGCSGTLSGNTYTTGAITADCTVSASFMVQFRDGQAASVVIGQAAFETIDWSGATTRNRIKYPCGNADVVNGVLYLSDTEHFRVLGFNGIPSASDADADFVLGASDFTTDGNMYAQGISHSDSQLFVADGWNDLIYTYAPIPTTTTVTPAFQLTAPTTGGFSSVEAVSVGGGKLVAADANHNRVLVWSTIPTAADPDPDLVLGQADLFGTSANRGGSVAADTMFFPSGVWTDGTRLVVNDTYNHRVLIWNTFPTTNGQAANRVLGQADFTHNARNRGAGTSPSANTLSGPYLGVYAVNEQLIVADSGNNRVLVWNSWPTTDGQPADNVLGQPDFTTNVSGNWGASDLDSPSGVMLYGTQLIVTDSDNSRYVVFDGN